MNLVIVESPTKARKLSAYLGNEFVVKASVGHVRDLPKSKLGVDIDNNFEPEYVVSKDKTKVLRELSDLAKEAKIIYLATDPDREGEAIAWHVKVYLEKKLKKKLEFKRATFHEITKTAVVHALENPSEVRMPLVDAQQARRVLDRLVGYKASPVLWKKIRRGLSAGRVQSVALRLIAEREKEIENFKPEEFWEVFVGLNTSDVRIDPSQIAFGDTKVQLPESAVIMQLVKVNQKKFEPKTEKDVSPLRKVLPHAVYSVQEVQAKEVKRASLPPFTTSTLQQKAATMLGYSSKQTMSIAQKLYEEGLITYHRTDSVNLSAESVQMARSFIESQYGKEYLPSKPRLFSKTTKNAQEAHEAIRVTDLAISQDHEKLQKNAFSPQHKKLYDLIWRRFVASQMVEAKYNRTTIIVEYNYDKAEREFQSGELRTTGSILKFAGWMKLFPSGEDVFLPKISEGQKIDFIVDHFLQKFTSPPPRYNDASVIKELEKRGIGRPSTYASIISVIVQRGYVERQQKRFFATPIGMTVTEFLMKYFPTFMEYEFTAEMEEDLDRISRGEKDWKKVIGTFYSPFAKKIESVTEDADRMQVPVEKTGELCPECGTTEKGEVVIRTGKYGKFLSCSRYPDCKYTKNIVRTVEDVLCPLCQKGDVLIKNSRWGKDFYGCSRYPECTWANWKKPEKGETITQAEWEEQQKAREERKKQRAERFAKKDGETTAKAKKKKTVKKKVAKKT